MSNRRLLLPLWLLIIGLLLVGDTTANEKSSSEDSEDDGFIDDEGDVAQDMASAEPKEEYKPPPFKAPTIAVDKAYLAEYFADKQGIGRRWYTSVAKKEGAEEALAKYSGEWAIGTPSKALIENDYGLVVKSKARHHAIATAFKRPFQFSGQTLVVQYEVMYEEGQECGGGYVKLLSAGSQEKLEQFTDKSPYTVMFGPDKCGTTSKVHLIIRHENPKNGTISEHHAKQSTKSLSSYFEDKLWHLYTMVIKPDNTFRVLVDNQEIMSGSLLSDLEPAITPPKQIPDPDDKKPADWDDREKIVDPEDKKPEDWDENQPKEVLDTEAQKPDDWLEDEPLLIPDLEAKQPEDWDTEMDGEWEAKKVANPKCASDKVSGCGKWTPPMKTNPLYKGKWVAKKIANPAYKGKWTAKLIDNPSFFEADPYKQLKAISALGIELWTMSKDIVFDNILITDSEDVAHRFAEQTFEVKKAQEKLYTSITSPSPGVFKQLLDAAEEKPWIWAVYVLVVLVPVILISVFYFSKKSSQQKTHPKKTDEAQPDSHDADGEDIEGEEGEPEEDAGTDHTDEGSDIPQEDSAEEKSPRRSARRSSKHSQNSKERNDGQPSSLGEVEASKEATAPSASPSTTTRRARQRRQD